MDIQRHVYFIFFSSRISLPCPRSLSFSLYGKNQLLGSGGELRCLSCSPLPLLSNTQNGFVASDRGSEDLPSVTASASLTLEVQNTAGKALEIAQHLCEGGSRVGVWAPGWRAAVPPLTLLLRVITTSLSQGLLLGCLFAALK